MTYMNKLLKLGEQLKGTPGLFHVAIYHDGWCAIFNGDLCNCDPDVKMVKAESEMTNPKETDDH